MWVFPENLFFLNSIKKIQQIFWKEPPILFYFKFVYSLCLCIRKLSYQFYGGSIIYEDRNFFLDLIFFCTDARYHKRTAGIFFRSFLDMLTYISTFLSFSASAKNVGIRFFKQKMLMWNSSLPSTKLRRYLVNITIHFFEQEN